MGNKRLRTKGPLDRFTASDPEIVVASQDSEKQSSIKDLPRKKRIDHQHIAKWYYEAGISFMQLP